jgi:hypothetical protein
MKSTTSNSSTTESITADSSATPLDAATEPTTVEPSSGFVDFILHRLRVAEMRTKLIATEIETMTTALSAGLIPPETVVLWLAETGIEVSSHD